MEYYLEKERMEENVYKNIKLELNGEIGYILIKEKNNNLIVSINVKNKNYDFLVNDPLRVYNIISQINISFNYDN